MAETVRVQVCYATPERQPLRDLDLPAGSTLGQAIAASGLLQEFPEIDLQKNKVGIFGRIRKLDTPLSDNDRVEIYRPLIADAKESRRRRAAKK